MADPRIRVPGAKKRDRAYLAAYAREWRRKAGPRSMYHHPDAIVQHYLKHGSMAKTADELGLSFYTVRHILESNGIKPNRRS